MVTLKIVAGAGYGEMVVLGFGYRLAGVDGGGCWYSYF